MCGITEKYIFVHELTKNIRLKVSHLKISLTSFMKPKKRSLITI